MARKKKWTASRRGTADPRTFAADEEKALLDSGPLPKDEIHRLSHKVFNLKLHEEDEEEVAMCPMGFTMDTLHEHVPTVCVMGMQTMEATAEQAAVEYASEMLDEGINRGFSHEADTMERKAVRRQTMAAVHQRVVDEVTEAAFSWPLNVAVFVAVLAQLLVGYNIGVMNAPEPVVFPDHTTASWSLAVAAFAAGGPFGATIAGSVADERGRRNAILMSAWMFAIGGAFQSLAPGMTVLVVARLIIGFASGFTSVLVPIYLGELAPPTLRGTLGTLTQFATVTGILVADLASFPLAEPVLWRALFGVNVVIALCIILLAQWLLESPSWLLRRDPKSEEARRTLGQLRSLSNPALIEIEATHLLSASKAQSSSESSTGSLKELLADSNYRMLLISAYVLHIAQQLSGINAVFYYSNSFFKGVIDNPLVGTTLVGAVNVAATYVALLLMETTDRRALLLWSSGGMMVCSVVVVLSLLGFFNNLVALAGVNLYVIFFEIGLGPIPWLIVAELFDSRYVASAMSACSQLNWVFNFIVGLGFPFLQKYLGPYSFGPFAVILLLTFGYTLVFLPETRGKSPAEIHIELVKRRDVKKLHVD